MDRLGAVSYLQRIIPCAQFRLLISSSTLPILVDCFFFCSLFAYGAKSLCIYDLVQVFLLRCERVLNAIFSLDLMHTPHTTAISKLLSIIPWYTITLLGLGQDDMMRQAIVLQQYLTLPHKAHLSTTPLSSLYAHIATITRDIPQRLRWIKAVELLPAGNIPPYYDAYRALLLSTDLLLQEDGLFSWDSFGQTPPPEPELGFRLYVLDHIHTAIAKLPSYPEYVFRDVDAVKRSINSAFSASRSLTLARLGRLEEAIPLAAEVLSTLRPDEVHIMTTVVALATISAAQIAVFSQKTELIFRAFVLLNAFIPEIPRVVPILHRFLARLQTLSLPFSTIAKQYGTEESVVLTNMKYHHTRRHHSALKSAPPPTIDTAITPSLTTAPLAATQPASSGGRDVPSSSSNMWDRLQSAMPTSAALPLGPSSSSSSSAALLQHIFPTPGRPYIPPSNPYFSHFSPSPFGSIDFSSMQNPFGIPSSWQNSLQTLSPAGFGLPMSDDHTFLGQYMQTPLASEPPHPLTLLGQRSAKPKSEDVRNPLAWQPKTLEEKDAPLQ